MHEYHCEVETEWTLPVDEGKGQREGNGDGNRGKSLGEDVVREYWNGKQESGNISETS